MRRRSSRFMWQFTKFSAVGMSNTLVDVGVFSALVLLLGWTGGAWVILASAIGFVAGGVNSYLWNSRLTFGTGYHGQELAAVIRFAIVLVSGVVLTSGVVAGLMWIQPPGPTAIAGAKAAAIMAGAIWGFSLQRYWVFTDRQRHQATVSVGSVAAARSGSRAEADTVIVRSR